MSQELEIEFKNLLTKNEYMHLRALFQPKGQKMIVQVNHYFDTPLFHLKKNNSALRIREINGQYQLTLKQPVEEGVLETHQLIDPVTAQNMMNGGGLVSGEIHDLLLLLDIPAQKIIHFGSLETHRIETPYENGLLVLDQSSYLNHEDFELEYEVSNREEGEYSFMKLLSTYEIPLRETDSKIKRFYKEKIRQAQLK